ncbi:hypothetical protein B9Q06_04160 [Candidatus Marsarchaeota G2 archaeon ECH_B_2]|uniref:PIN domain-containing protein n=5 Tax=Candidatus Marsarchaeota group 2 TaxID=2203771 RepID=A0A2R6BAT3_9ARCH|nr:MAG: hypothetical protein B9Q06_04160 [Candidatus Marsarchaeota G2 archaeon ECH_B_2]PSO00550.1 MAG: hypothetical protein B9Q07_02990 [Candidatus Marsarchaeota G2 archaeon ECH_B_3]
MMAVYIDTGIFVAANNRSDSNHVRAVKLLMNALNGVFGLVYTSDYVIDEAITTALARTRSHILAANTGSYIIQSPRIRKLYTGPEEFSAAWETFLQLKDKPMSFTDCVSLVHIRRHRIHRIMSFDSGFDVFVERVS